MLLGFIGVRNGFLPKTAHFVCATHLCHCREPPPIYDLFATSNHIGGLGGGHYVANCLSKHDLQWYLFNDSVVSSTSSAELQGPMTYVLFYHLAAPSDGVEQPAPVPARAASTDRKPSSASAPGEKSAAPAAPPANAKSAAVLERKPPDAAAPPR